MTLRRRAARLATVCGLLVGLVMLGASPALADEDSVRVGAASSFAAGGSPQGVNVAVHKRSGGCVLLRTALGLRLDGLQPDQVAVQVNTGGHWLPVSVSGGGGTVTTGQTSPAKPTLCKGKSITVRYRVAFAAGAPGGRLYVTGAGLTATGQQLGHGADTAKVSGRVSPSPTPTPSKKPTPSPTPTEVAAAGEVVDPAALGPASVAPSTTAVAAESGGGSPIMFVGIGLVAIGLLLIVLLVRRFRQDRTPADEQGPLPGNPGGTTYRAGGGSPAVPGHPGPVYGQQPPTVPVPRPAPGGVYGARPATPSPDATQLLPGAPGAPGARPGPDDPDGGDHTVFMPRLPG